MSISDSWPESRFGSAVVDPYKFGRRPRGREPDGNGGESTGRGEGGPASRRVIVGYGLWIFLLSAFVMFSAFFAAYAVLGTSTAGGPSAHDLFDPTRVAVETACLLTSSF